MGKAKGHEVQSPWSDAGHGLLFYRDVQRQNGTLSLNEARMSASNESLTGDRDVRCHCGQLVARWARQGLEIKCKRCRRLVYVSFKSISGSPPDFSKRAFE